MILNFLFPRQCLGCGRNGNYFCLSCLKKIKILESQVSLRERPFQAVFSIFAYEGIVRQAILKIKYRFVSDLADELVDLAVQSFQQDLFEFSNDLFLVPIPLYWYRQNWRGFNQAVILGEKLAKQLKIDFCPDLLVRTRTTKPQVKLKGKQRKDNVRGAFKIHNSYSQGIPPDVLFRSSRIPAAFDAADEANKKQSRGQIKPPASELGDALLFDDVWTTGATMKECALVLRKAGVKRIFGLTLAR